MRIIEGLLKSQADSRNELGKKLSISGMGQNPVPPSRLSRRGATFSPDLQEVPQLSGGGPKSSLRKRNFPKCEETEQGVRRITLSGLPLAYCLPYFLDRSIFLVAQFTLWATKWIQKTYLVFHNTLWRVRSLTRGAEFVRSSFF